jgi:SAM-dependent methyltransferase
MASSEERAKFDRAAVKLANRRGHRAGPPRWIERLGLDRLPPRCEAALEVGCGLGNLSRILAQRCDRVVALDLSDEMIRIARERSAAHANIEYRVADATTWDFPAERFDCVASVASLHYMPLEPLLAGMKRALRPGGVMLIFDLYQPSGIRAALRQKLGVAVGRAKRALGAGAAARAVDRVWPHHSGGFLLSIREIREAAGRVLPGAEITEYQAAKRYSLAWTKPQ